MRGGTIVVHGNCGPRTAANMKGGTLIVDGSVGYLAGFMTHDGDLIVCGDAGEALGDSHVGRQHLRRRQDRAASAPTPWCAETDDEESGAAARAAAARGHRRRRSRSSRDQAEREALVLRHARSGGLAEDMSAERTHGYANGRSHIWTSRDDPRHPGEGRARPLPDPRVLDVPEVPELGRSRLPAGRHDAPAARGLPRALRDEDRDRRRQARPGGAPAGARHPGLPDVDELRRPRRQRQDGARQRLLDGRLRLVHRRGRHARRGARGVHRS